MAYNVGSTAGTKGVGSSFTSAFTSGGKAPGAKIKPAKVTMPNKNDFGPDPTRPIVGAPDVIARPNRKDFGMPDRTGIANAAKTANQAAKNFNDPTNSLAFTSLMGLASEKGASAMSEVDRANRNAASKAGYTGGFSSMTKQADAERFKALSEAGFAGAASVRDQEADMYGKASSSLSSLMSAYNSAMTASNVAFAGTLADRNKSQAELNLDAKKQQAVLDLGFSQLVQTKNLSFADATSAANQLQAQLDQAFNNSLIDNAKYDQMSASLQAQLATEQARLKEQGRQFDLTRADSKMNTALALEEAAKLRRERGIDPNTGQPFGQSHPQTGKPGSVFQNI
jgi:hypothetical protein